MGERASELACHEKRSPGCLRAADEDAAARSERLLGVSLELFCQCPYVLCPVCTLSRMYSTPPVLCSLRQSMSWMNGHAMRPSNGHGACSSNSPLLLNLYTPIYILCTSVYAAIEMPRLGRRLLLVTRLLPRVCRGGGRYRIRAQESASGSRSTPPARLSSKQTLSRQVRPLMHIL